MFNSIMPREYHDIYNKCNIRTLKYMITVAQRPVGEKFKNVVSGSYALHEVV